MTAHKHAELMAQYAQDAQETERPWELWEGSSTGGWQNLSMNPCWFTDVQYRRKAPAMKKVVYECWLAPGKYLCWYEAGWALPTPTRWTRIPSLDMTAEVPA